MSLQQLKLGVNSCLLGKEVRYDGSHKRDRFITDELGKYVQYVPVCPEVEAGFPIPREAFRLVGDPANPRFMTARSKEDHTETMRSFCDKRVKEYEKESLCGFIFKSKSPSNALYRLKVYNEQTGMPVQEGRGFFAEAFVNHFPEIPVEEDGRLNDANLRDNFLSRVFTCHRFNLLKADCSAEIMQEFHNRHYYLLHAHSSESLPELEKLLESAKKESSPGDGFQTYRKAVMDALKEKTSTQKKIQTMSLLVKEMEAELSSDDVLEMKESIDKYKQDILPLAAPLLLLKHFAKALKKTMIATSYFFEPYPPDLAPPNCRL